MSAHQFHQCIYMNTSTFWWTDEWTDPPWFLIIFPCNDHWHRLQWSTLRCKLSSMTPIISIINLTNQQTKSILNYIKTSSISLMKAPGKDYAAFWNEKNIWHLTFHFKFLLTPFISWFCIGMEARIADMHLCWVIWT